MSEMAYPQRSKDAGGAWSRPSSGVRGFVMAASAIWDRASVRGSRGTGSAVRTLAMLVALFALFAVNAVAQTRDPTPLEFSTAAEEQRFQRLTAELRCVMCQNQSLADSDAQIASDLRREVLELMREGKDDAQVKQFLVERYGEFVLYRPQVSWGTWLLWFGPGLLLVAGGVVVWRIIASRNGSTRVPVDDGQEW